VSAALVFGTGIHAAIEDFYRAELAGEAKPEVEQLLFAYRSAWLPQDPEAMIKQHLFCKSRFSEVGHLASMFR
jgi:hypothetical protein